MTLLEMANIVAGRLGRRTEMIPEILDELRLAQVTVEGTPPYPWFLVKGWYPPFNLQVNTLPEDFIEFFEDCVFLESKDNVPYDPPFRLIGGYVDHVQTSVGRTEQPQRFSLLGRSMYLYPIPDATYQARIYYVGKEPILANEASSNAWSVEAPDLLIATAGEHIAETLRQPEMIQVFGRRRMEARQRVELASVSRRESMRQAAIGAGGDLRP